MAMKHRDLILYELKRRLEQKKMNSFIRKMAEIKSAGFADPAQCEKEKVDSKNSVVSVPQIWRKDNEYTTNKTDPQKL